MKTKIISLFTFLSMAAIFSIAIGGQRFLFVNNQAVYYLNGLAYAGKGYLLNDWIVLNGKSLPTFDYFVYYSVELFSDNFFYVVMFFLQGIYVYSLIKIANIIFEFNNKFIFNLIYFSVLIFSYSLWWIQISTGVATQDLTLYALMPATFGIFLLVSIYLYLTKHIYLSIVALCVAAYFHSAYLISAGLLTLSYLTAEFIESKNFKVPIRMGGLALILISPILVYNSIVHAQTNPDLWQEMVRLLVHDFLPFHSLPPVWLDEAAIIKFLSIILGIFIIRRTRIFYPMLIPSIVLISTTLITYYFPNDFISFWQPWRVSTFLVPLATAILLGYFLKKLLIEKLINSRQEIIFGILSSILILFSIQNGLGNFEKYVDNRVRYNQQFSGLFNFVVESLQPDDLYLVPPGFGAKFRINTGAPVFFGVNKYPFTDTVFFEWYDRYKMANDFYRSDDEACDELNELIDFESITHVVLPPKHPASKCDKLSRIYKDKKYFLFSVED